MNLRSIGFLACLLPTLVVSFGLGETTDRSYDFVPSRQNSKLRQEIDNIFEATNTVRADKRRGLLQKDSRLMAAAQHYAELMATKEVMSHTIGGLSLAGKADKVGYTYRTLGENIALNSDLDGRFVVYEQWMKSKGHRQNLLAKDVSQIGIGIAGPSKRNKLYYYCQIFGAPLAN